MKQCKECLEWKTEDNYRINRALKGGLFHKCKKCLARPKKLKSLEERFWEKVDKRGEDECWEWQGAKNNRPHANHGHFSYKGVKAWKSMQAHRMAYILTYGEFDRTLFICHTCDNPPCCNPKHLYAGTALDNARDRQERGNYIARAKLTPAQVLEIRVRHKKGENYKTLSRAYNVTDGCIGHIIRGLTWVNI